MARTLLQIDAVSLPDGTQAVRVSLVDLTCCLHFSGRTLNTNQAAALRNLLQQALRQSTRYFWLLERSLNVRLKLWNFRTIPSKYPLMGRKCRAHFFRCERQFFLTLPAFPWTASSRHLSPASAIGPYYHRPPRCTSTRKQAFAQHRRPELWRPVFFASSSFNTFIPHHVGK